jgi:signal transduction histidine kinase
VRLVLSLLIASLLTSMLVLAGYGYISLEFHRASLSEDMQRDHRVMVGVLVEAVESVYAQHGEPAARRLVDEVNLRRDNVHLTWTDDGTPQAYGIIHRFVDGEASLETHAAVVVDGHVVGSLDLVESFEETERVLNQRRIRIALTGLVMLVCGTLAGSGVGLFLVDRRVRRLVEHARRVAEGDLDGRIDAMDGKDELAELGRELNAMTTKLAVARAQVMTEAKARVRALEQLRHAERLMTVGKLAAGMAHELGTPLNVVGESARMIARGETDEPTTIEYAGIIADQTDRMTRILRQLMDFARRRPPHRQAADLSDVARMAVELIGPLADARSVQLTLVAEAPCVAWIDRDQVQQVLANLLVNAIHASYPPGAVEVTVRKGPAARDVEESMHPYACVEVTDHGSGIPEDVIERVFEPFFTTKDVGEGTGLGLSVAYGLTEEHGGWIEVDSRIGAGSTFRVWLPLYDGTADPPADGSPS